MDTNLLIGCMYGAIITVVVFYFMKNQTGQNGPEAERRAQVTK